MSKGLKITLIVLTIVIILGLAGFLLFYLFSGKGSIEEQQSLNSRLDTPKNLALDSDLTLKFDEVPNAVGYLIYVNGEEKKIVYNNQATWAELFGENSKTYGKYIFSVKALYTDADYHSNISEPFEFTRTITLKNVAVYGWVGEQEFTWDEVPDALSYIVRVYSVKIDAETGREVRSENAIVTTKTETSSFNLARLIDVSSDAYKDVVYFEIHILASAKDVNNENGDEYVLDSNEDDITENQILRYYLTQTLPAIAINVGEVKEQGERLILNWNTISDNRLKNYEVYLDEELLTTLSPSAGTSIDLNKYKQADTLGTHSIYVLAVPKTNNNNVRIRGSKSEEHTYRVEHHLGYVSPSQITISKENAYLQVSWPSVEEIVTRDYEINGENQHIVYSYRATSYTVEFWASESMDGDYTFRYAVDTPLNVLSTELSRFREYSTNNGFVRVKIKANYDSISDDRNYIIGNAEATGYSEPCMIVSTLDDITDVNINGYLFTWREVKNAVGYTVRLYQRYTTNVWQEATNVDAIEVDNYYRLDLKSWFVKLNADPILYRVTVQAVGDNVFYRSSNESKFCSVEYSLKLNSTVFINKAVTSSGEIRLQWAPSNKANSYHLIVQTEEQKNSGKGFLIDTLCASTEFTSTDFAKHMPYPCKLYLSICARNDSEGYFYTSSDYNTDEFDYTKKYSTPEITSVTTDKDTNAIKVNWSPIIEENNGHSSDLMYYVQISKGDVAIYKEIVKNEVGDLNHDCTFDKTDLMSVGIGELDISVIAKVDVRYTASLYIESDADIMENYEYIYTLHEEDIEFLKPEFTVDTVNQKVTLKARYSSVPYVNYYKVVLNHSGSSDYIYVDLTKTEDVISVDGSYVIKAKSGDIEFNMDSRFDSTLLPLYVDTTIKFYPGLIWNNSDTDKTQDYIDVNGISTETHFDNVYYVDAPIFNAASDLRRENMVLQGKYAYNI